jgi:hypothetical protein
MTPPRPLNKDEANKLMMEILAVMLMKQGK